MSVLLFALVGALVALAFFERRLGWPAPLLGAAIALSPTVLLTFGNAIEKWLDPVELLFEPDPVGVATWYFVRQALPSAFGAMVFGPLVGMSLTLAIHGPFKIHREEKANLPATAARLGMIVWLTVTVLMIFTPGGSSVLFPLSGYRFEIPSLSASEMGLNTTLALILLASIGAPWRSLRPVLARIALVGLLIYVLAFWAIRDVPPSVPCEWPYCFEGTPTLET